MHENYWFVCMKCAETCMFQVLHFEYGIELSWSEIFLEGGEPGDSPRLGVPPENFQLS